MPVEREDMRLVERVASRFTRRLPDHLRDDVRSDGMLALIKAVEDWETVPYWHYEFTRVEFIAGRARRAMVDGFRERNGYKRTGYRKQKFEERMVRLDVVLDGLEKEDAFHEVVGQLDRDLEDVGVLEMLAELPEREREIMVRHVLDGETQKEIADSLGLHESRVSQLLSRATARLRGENVPMTMDPRKSERLSNRELDVLQRVAEGETNDQIAGALFVSSETVKSHIRHIHAKLGAKSRAHAVAIAIREKAIR